MRVAGAPQCFCITPYPAGPLPQICNKPAGASSRDGACLLLSVRVRIGPVRQQAGVVAVDHVIYRMLGEQLRQKLWPQLVRHTCMRGTLTACILRRSLLRRLAPQFQSRVVAGIAGLQCSPQRGCQSTVPVALGISFMTALPHTDILPVSVHHH